MCELEAHRVITILLENKTYALHDKLFFIIYSSIFFNFHLALSFILEDPHHGVRTSWSALNQ